MKILQKNAVLILLFSFPLFVLLGCSSDDDQLPSPPGQGTGQNDNEEEPKDPDPEGSEDTSLFEAIVSFPDLDEELEFTASGDNVGIYIGEVEVDDDNKIPNAVMLIAQDDDSKQQLSLLGAEVTGEGIYSMGEDEFDLASLLSMYKRDRDDGQVENNVYIFHQYELDMRDEDITYKTEAVLNITSLTDDRVQGTLDIVMFSFVMSLEETDDGDKKYYIDDGDYLYKGTISAEFDLARQTEIIDTQD